MTDQPTIYLAGPIHGCTDAEACDWRTYVKQQYAGPTLDPMRRDYRGSEDEAAEQIVELDKTDVEVCDVLLANCPRPSYGTAMEILYAWLMLKPVVVILPPEQPVSPWIRYHATVVVHTLDDALHALEGVPASW